jgi:hypothetical protein
MTAAVKLRPETPAPVAATGPHVYSAIADVMDALAREGITKNRRNTQGSGYNFRGIDDVYNALSVILAESRLCIIPRVLSRECVERVSKSGGNLFYTTVDVEFDLISAVDGSKHTARTVGEAMDSGDKSSNKAMSAAYKYMAFQTFCIPTEADNDADASTHDVAPRQQASAPGQTKTTGADVPKVPTLAERADRLEAALKAQTTADNLRKAYGLASGLCASLDDKLPERLAEINALYERLFAALSEPKPKDDFGIGEDEIPF